MRDGFLSTKTKMSYLFYLRDALERLAQRMEYGHNKHGSAGVKVLRPQEYLDKAYRHLYQIYPCEAAYEAFEDEDIKHMVSGAFNLLALAQLAIDYRTINDSDKDGNDLYPYTVPAGSRLSSIESGSSGVTSDKSRREGDKYASG